jgi:hypothetical protein
LAGNEKLAGDAHFVFVTEVRTLIHLAKRKGTRFKTIGKNILITGRRMAFKHFCIFNN